MAEKNNQKIINIFDLIALFFIVALVVIGVFAYAYKPVPQNNNVLLTFKSLTPEASLIQNTAQSQWEVFFNSVNAPVKVVSVRTEGGNLFVVLEAPGSTGTNNYIFNGQRVLIGQKAEIHGNYFAQGLITEVKNEN